jgi:4-diphosphocytidyl-2-C-methyl-D-erythritol kinase
MSIKAYAKLNLFLEVINKRPDQYHNLRSIMTSVDLYDTIYLKSLKKDAIIIRSDKTEVPTDRSNIVYRICEYVKQTYRISSGVYIYIRKRIPIGGGLAGGSSNGAAVLQELNKLWNLNLSDDELKKIALKFGSDIPYCLFHKTALATSRGEILSFLNIKYEGFVLIINPNISVSTKEIFTNYPVKSKPLEQFNVENFRNCDIMSVSQYFYNELEGTVFDRYPDILEIIIQLKHLSEEHPLMSGSGSTVFAVFKTKKEALKVASEYRKINHDHFVCVKKFI